MPNSDDVEKVETHARLQRFLRLETQKKLWIAAIILLILCCIFLSLFFKNSYQPLILISLQLV